MGFCFGVSGAVNLCKDIIFEQNDIHNNVYILGMLVHNKSVIQDMLDMGFTVLKEENLLNGTIKINKNDIVVIRAHGTTKEIYTILQETGATIYDATCIFVKKIKEALEEAENKKNEIIFIGDSNHPEVKGIVSFGKTVHIIPSFSKFLEFKIQDNINYTLLTQTTFNKEEFFKIKDYVIEKYNNIEIFSKICGATYDRQKAVEELAKECDIILIVGDITSSNSKKLHEISKLYNPKSYLIQNLTEFKDSWLEGFNSVGITAGASTPEKLIIEIEKYIRGNFDDKHGL